MLTSSISNTKRCHSAGESCNFMDSLCFYFLVWQMLLPMVLGQLDVIGRCYCHVSIRFCTLHFVLAGVIAMLLYYGRWWCCYHQADVLASVCIGRCYCHLFLWLLVLPLLTISCTKRCTTCYCFYYFVGRCYCQDGWWCCQVYNWQMLLPGGWWNAYHGCGWQMS